MGLALMEQKMSLHKLASVSAKRFSLICVLALSAIGCTAYPTKSGLCRDSNESRAAVAEKAKAILNQQEVRPDWGRKVGEHFLFFPNYVSYLVDFDAPPLVSAGVFLGCDGGPGQVSVTRWGTLN